MINLITGLPGHGKSLYTLWHVKKRVDQENKELIAAGKEPRQVFYNGIPDLKLDWHEFPDADKWFELPVGSIIVIDEAQRSFRPRGNAGAVPVHVAKLETHRHQGFDLYVITQHPLLLDGNLRRLVDRHYHVHRPFGWKKSTVLDYQGVKDQPMSKGNRADAQKTVFSFPKELYSQYKSAEVHTAKARLPGKFLILLAAPVLVIGMGWFVWQNLHGMGKPQQQPGATTVTTGAPRPDQAPKQSPKMTREEWIDAYQPRLAGLAYTAPRYDEVTKPTKAPFPDACIQSAKQGCKCYTKQATILDVSKELCQQIVEKGFYRDFDDPENQRITPATGPAPAAVAPMAEADRTQINMLGGTPPKSLDPRYGTYTSPTPSSSTGPAASTTTESVPRRVAVALK